MTRHFFRVTFIKQIYITSNLQRKRLFLFNFHRQGHEALHQTVVIASWSPHPQSLVFHSFIRAIFVSADVNVSVICPALPTTLPAEQDSFSYGPHLRYLRLDGNEIKPPIPTDLMTCFRLLQAVII